jgi:hypothetical protein
MDTKATKKHVLALDNAQTWSSYRESTVKTPTIELEIRFPVQIRQPIHNMAVRDLSGLLMALSESFYDEDVRESPPDEIEQCGYVLDQLRHAIDTGCISDFSEYIRLYFVGGKFNAA